MAYVAAAAASTSSSASTGSFDFTAVTSRRVGARRSLITSPPDVVGASESQARAAGTATGSSACGSEPTARGRPVHGRPPRRPAQPYCLCVLRARIVFSTSMRQKLATWFNAGPMAPGRRARGRQGQADGRRPGARRPPRRRARRLRSRRDVRIPGFRKGKVPMPVLVQRVGKERVYAEAVDTHIGGWFWNAAPARASPGRAARVRVRAADVRQRGLDLHGHRPGAGEAGAGRLDDARGAEARGRGARGGRQARARRPAAHGRRARPGRRPPGPGGRRRRRRPRLRGRRRPRDYVVELGSERLVDEIENGLRRLAPARRPRDRATSSPTAAAGATVTVKELKEKVCRRSTTTWRRPRPSSTRSPSCAATSSPGSASRSRTRSRASSARPPSTSSSRRRRSIAAGPVVEVRTRELLTRPCSAASRRAVSTPLLPAADGPDAGGARAAAARRGVAVGRARARARGGRDKLGIEVTDDEIREAAARGRARRRGHRGVHRGGRRRHASATTSA